MKKDEKMMGWSDMAGPVGVASKMAVDMPGAISQYWAGSVDVLNHSLRLGFKVVQSHTDFAYFNAGLQNAYLTSCIPERVDATKVKNIIGFEASCWSEWDSTLEKHLTISFPVLQLMPRRLGASNRQKITQTLSIVCLRCGIYGRHVVFMSEEWMRKTIRDPVGEEKKGELNII